MNIKVFTKSLLNDLICAARQSPRTRQHLNIHESYSDPCQRLFNAIGFDSYIRPHRHSLDPQTESLFAICGAFALIAFDDCGTPEAVIRFGVGPEASAAGVEVGPDTWHTVLALTEGAVLLEMKAGPFDPTAAKELASWAPEEGSSEASGYLISLRAVLQCPQNM